MLGGYEWVMLRRGWLTVPMLVVVEWCWCWQGGELVTLADGDDAETW